MGHADNERLLSEDEQRDLAIAEAARRHAAAIRTNILTGHEQTLQAIAEDFANRVSMPGVTEQLVRTTMACGSVLAGQMLLDLVQKGIDAEAELEGIKEIERLEAAVPAAERQRNHVMRVRREITAAYSGYQVSA